MLFITESYQLSKVRKFLCQALDVPDGGWQTGTQFCLNTSKEPADAKQRYFLFAYTAFRRSKENATRGTDRRRP